MAWNLHWNALQSEVRDSKSLKSMANKHDRAVWGNCHEGIKRKQMDFDRYVKGGGDR